jgi:hypothetical protein
MLVLISVIRGDHHFWEGRLLDRPANIFQHFYNGGMHPVARIIKSQDKPSFATNIVHALFRVLYAHNMFRLLPKTIFRWYFITQNI